MDRPLLFHIFVKRFRYILYGFFETVNFIFSNLSEFMCLRGQLQNKERPSCQLFINKLTS